MLLSHICGAEQSENLDSVDIEGFDNDELSAEFSRLKVQENSFLVSQSTRVVLDEPPNKRRKVHEGTRTLEEITADLSELLGSQRVSTMDGLHQVAEWVKVKVTMPEF